MLVKVNNIWGCITVCDDKLIIEEVEDIKTKNIYYCIKEYSYDIEKIYTYDDTKLPDILDTIIHKCAAVIKLDMHLNKNILYGPNLSKKTENNIIAQYDIDYFTKHHELEINREDKKMKVLCNWLNNLVNDIKD